MRASIRYEHVTRESVTRECRTLGDLLRALAEIGGRSRDIEFHDAATGQSWRVRAELLGETTGVVNR